MLKLTWNTETGQLSGRWAEGEERPEYEVILIEPGAALERLRDDQARQFLLAKRIARPS
jgi:hypothetical protein